MRKTTPDTTLDLPACDDLEQRIAHRLENTIWRNELSDVSVRVGVERIELVGSVASYHLKSVAQTLVVQERTGRRVHNAIVVRPARARRRAERA